MKQKNTKIAKKKKAQINSVVEIIAPLLIIPLDIQELLPMLPARSYTHMLLQRANTHLKTQINNHKRVLYLFICWHT